MKWTFQMLPSLTSFHGLCTPQLVAQTHRPDLDQLHSVSHLAPFRSYQCQS